VREGLHLAHQRILDRAAREPLWMGTGASVVVAQFREEQLRLTHVGSARAYRLREGVLEPLTEDHSLANELRRQGQPISEGSVQSFERILFRLVGAESERFEVEERNEQVAPGDVYVLCSRPLALLLGEERMATVLRRDAPAQALCDELMSLADGAREAVKEWANLSVVVVRVVAGGA
jgi:PPM family protein phosphatase